MIVRLPPPSTLRAAPKSRFGGCRATGSMPPESVRPEGGERQVVGAGEARDAVEQDHDVAAAFDQPLGALERHLGDAGLLFDGIVEGGRDDFGVLDGAPPVGDLLRALADEDDHDVDVVVGLCRGAGDRLQEHRLTGLRRRDDESALSAADGRDEVDDAGGEVVDPGSSRWIISSGKIGVSCSK